MHSRPCQRQERNENFFYLAYTPSGQLHDINVTNSYHCCQDVLYVKPSSYTLNPRMEIENQHDLKSIPSSKIAVCNTLLQH